MSLRISNPLAEIGDILEAVRALTDPHFSIRNTLMGLQADVQKLIDEVAANSSLAQASNQALQIQSKQITDLQTQIGTLQAGAPIDAEDLAAIQKAVSDLAETNTALQTAVPAVPPAEPAPDQTNKV